MRLRFFNARLVDESRDEKGELLVEGGRVVSLEAWIGGRPPSPRSQAQASEPCLEIDCAGRVLMPAFVDLHAHFRDPGQLDKERLESACLAAVAGGYGTLVAMANTKPATSLAQSALAQRVRARELGLADYYPALTMSRGLLGVDCSHLDGLEDLLATAAGGGLRLLSDDGGDVADEGLLRAILERAKTLDLLVSCHCELPGADDDRVAEVAGIERVLRLGAEIGGRLHIAHVSTAESVELLRRAKVEIGSRRAGGERSLRLTCEVTPHHLALTSERADKLGRMTLGRVNPPLREERDRLALIEGLGDGTIDAIATDHAPHSLSDKLAGAPGFSGLESAFALSWDRLSAAGFALQTLSALMSARPARILGLRDRGLLDVGQRADLVLADPEAIVTIDPATFRSRGKNSAVAGLGLRGRILMTIQEGRIVHDQT